MIFNPNRKFKRKYDRIFQRNPEAANLFLLLAELGGDKGQVKTDTEELAGLMAARFNDLKEYALHE